MIITTVNIMMVREISFQKTQLQSILRWGMYREEEGSLYAPLDPPPPPVERETK